MQRTRALADAVRRRFWLPSAIAIAAGVLLGYWLPRLDNALGLDPGLFSFTDADAARSMLQSIATVTISVAGVAFSVTVVALVLASQQLGPRVLRTFETDRLNQVTLGALLGPFAFAIVLLTQFEASGDELPHVSLGVAVLAALAAIGFFVAFVQHTVTSLQAATVIDRIASEGRRTVPGRHPEDFGSPAGDGGAPPALPGRDAAVPVRAEAGGYLTLIEASTVLAAARAVDAVVVQRIAVGDYVITGEVLAELVPAGDAPLEDPDACAGAVRDAFVLGHERTMAQDVAFPLRQLADIALRGLSPSLNDPTTAENSMDAAAGLLTSIAERRAPVAARADDDGALRFVASVPDLDDLVRLTFEQVRLSASGHPVLGRRLLHLLRHIERTAAAHDHPTAELARQGGLLAAQLAGDQRGSADGAGSPEPGERSASRASRR
jgi:uncharacterized membrane protein